MAKHRRIAPSRAEIAAQLRDLHPPRLDVATRADLSLVHHINLDAIRSGTADQQIIIDWAAGVLTWWRTAIDSGHAVLPMCHQLAFAFEVIASHAAGLPSPLCKSSGYELARHGVIVQDELARIVPKNTAIAAATWSNDIGQLLINAMATRSTT